MTISQLLSNGSRVQQCHYVMSPTGCLPLSKPVMSNERQCEWCKGIGHFCPMVEPGKINEYAWLCSNPLCKVYSRTKHTKEYQPTTQPRRSLEWALFCEISGIGDLYHDVSFDGIEDHTAARMEYLTKFVAAPKSLILMRGPAGTGKTYMAMASCEYVTRTESNVIFTTQKELADKWLQTFKEDTPSGYAHKVMEAKLLVIDDFGTAELSKSLLEFIMQVINTRLQWSNRGTIISTNLDSKKLAEYCGEALSDRINTGQLFLFSGPSRRKKIIL